MKKTIRHYSKTLLAELTVTPQWILSSNNIIGDKVNSAPARSFTVTSNIMGFNYMTVIGIQQHELIFILEKIELATNAYMELMYQGNAPESNLTKLGYS